VCTGALRGGNFFWRGSQNSSVVNTSSVGSGRLAVTLCKLLGLGLDNPRQWTRELNI
jgi:hypothetical protein